MSDVDVRPVKTEKERDDFLRMPWTVYKDDPLWTAPLWRDHVNYFDPAHNPELKLITMQLYVAYRAGIPVGTIIPFIHHAYNKEHDVNVGWFGQFEVLNDSEAARALLQTAADWVKEQGADRILGPATYSTNSELGLLIDGFDIPPKLLMTHAPRYYQGFIDDFGFEKEMDLLAYHMDGNDWGGKAANNLPPKLVRVVEKLRARRNISFRHVELKNLDKELEIVKGIYHDAWETNWGFIPMTDEQFDQLAAEIKDFIDPRLAVFALIDGEEIGFGLPLPDMFKPMRKARFKPGEPHWWQLARLVWHWKVAGKVDGVRVWALGVKKEYHASGADAVMYYEMLINGLTSGYMDIEASWILEDNQPMNAPLIMMGMDVYKRYRLYTRDV